MILVDTSVWIDHLHQAERALAAALDDGEVVTHPFVIGELAVGRLRDRAGVLGALGEMPWLPSVGHGDALELIERRDLHGRGLGFIDIHLLASVLISPGARLWTRDRRLRAVAEELDAAWGGGR